MNESSGNGTGAHAEDALSSFFPRVAELYLGQGEEAGGAGPGVCEPSGEAGKLSATAKLFIERSAKRAAWDGNTRADACPYVYDTPEGAHWWAAFVLAGGLIR